MYSEVREILNDGRHERATRLIRLQGWRGEESAQAVASGWIVRLGPAVCSIGALLGVVLQSSVLLLVMALGAAIGAVTGKHPAVMVANAVVQPLGRTPQPPSRAGSRFGCFVGAVFLTASAVAYGLEFPVVGAVFGLFIAGLAAFVAATNICVPSIVVTTFGGTEYCTQASLLPVRA